MGGDRPLSFLLNWSSSKWSPMNSHPLSLLSAFGPFLSNFQLRDWSNLQTQKKTKHRQGHAMESCNLLLILPYYCCLTPQLAILRQFKNLMRFPPTLQRMFLSYFIKNEWERRKVYLWLWKKLLHRKQSKRATESSDSNQRQIFFKCT